MSKGLQLCLPPSEERKTLEVILTKLVWDALDMHRLIATVHERSNQSEVIDAFHKRAHRRYAHYLTKTSVSISS